MPFEFIEEHDHSRIVWLHPLGERAVWNDPSAVKVIARVDGPIFVVITAFPGAVGARLARIDWYLVDHHLYPAITAARAWLACSDYFFQCANLS